MPLFRRAKPAPAPAETGDQDHLLLIHLALSDGQFGTEQERELLFELESRIEHAIESAGAGELDGNEVGGGEFAIYVYGPDADRMFALAEPVLQAFGPRTGSWAKKRYGPPADGVREVRVELA